MATLGLTDDGLLALTRNQRKLQPFRNQRRCLRQQLPAAATTAPELAQLEPMARDLAAMRRSLEDLAVKQEQIAENIATLQAADQEIRQKMASRSQAPSDQPRKRPKPPGRLSPAQSPPVPPAPPVAQSPSQSRSDSP